MIFVIVSTVVHLKRRAKAKQNLGYTIHEGVGAGKFDLSQDRHCLSVDYEFHNGIYSDFFLFFYTYSTHCGHIGNAHRHESIRSDTDSSPYLSADCLCSTISRTNDWVSSLAVFATCNQVIIMSLSLCLPLLHYAIVIRPFRCPCRCQLPNHPCRGKY